MAAIFTVHLLLLINHFIETAKASSLRIAFLHVHFLFILYTVYVVGRALQLMHEFGRMHAWETSKFQKGGIIWLMLDFLHARNFLFHTKVFSITLLSGVMQISSKDLHFIWYWTQLNIANIQGLRTKRNYLICTVHQHAMQLNISLVFWSIDSEFYC